MTLKLTLLTIGQYTGKDGEEMAKCIFMSEQNKVYLGYMKADQVTPQLEQLITNGDSYVPERARAFEVRMDSYNDKLTYKVDPLSFS